MILARGGWERRGAVEGMLVVPYLLLAGQTRARMFRPENRHGDQEDAAHASSCQFSYGLIANLKMVTGRLAMGLDRWHSRTGC